MKVGDRVIYFKRIRSALGKRERLEVEILKINLECAYVRVLETGVCVRVSRDSLDARRV